MAPINYLPSFPISDRVFPCPRKYFQGVPYTPAVSMPSSSARPGSTAFCTFMGTEVHRLGDGFVFSGPSLADSHRLADQFFKAYPHLKDMLIYGQKSPSPPPATLTQEQLARDAGQLVEAHALLDKLCDDTDRSQHSLVHRIKQILLGSEEMNKVLEKAGFNTAAGLLVCVQGLAKQRVSFAERLDEADKRNIGYQMEIDRLKGRNKRLHDAQGSGSAEAAKLQKVRDTLSKLTSPNDRGVVGMAEDVVTMNLNQQGEIVRLRADTQAAGDPSLFLRVQKAHGHMNEAGVALEGVLNIEQRVKALVKERNLFQREAGKDPALDRMVQEAHRALHGAGVEPRCGTILERVQALIAERDLLKRTQNSAALDQLVTDCHHLLSRAGIDYGTVNNRIDQRISALIAERDKLKSGQADLLPNCHRALDCAGMEPGTVFERITELKNKHDQLKACSDTSALDTSVLRDKVQAAHLKLNTVEQVSTFGTIDERVTSLVDLFKAVNAERDRLAADVTAEAHRLLDSAAIPSGTIAQRVAALVRRCEHHASHYQAAVKNVGDLSNQLAAAKSVPLEDVQSHLKLNEIVEIERTGTLLERVTQVVAVVRNYSSCLDNCRTYLVQACRTLGVANIEGMTTHWMARQIGEELVRMRAAHKVTPDAAHCVKTVEKCVRKLNEANVICVPLPDRIQHLLDERAAVRRDLLNLAAVTATADSNRTLAARAVNRVTTMEKTIVAFANSPSVKELL